jgi:SpoVK/Ycf46/Vps4 family AAA+-type ATPase
VIDEIKKFWGLKQKFIESNTPYKRGILLFGPPGGGKTSCLRMVMEDIISRDGLIIEFSHPRTFISGYEIIRQIHNDKPLVVVMEDLDSIMECCNQSELLNVLDGLHDIKNTVFVATTNHPERLGSRVLNRPSRFDKRYFVGMPKPEARKTFLEFKGIKKPELDTWVKDTEGLSIAHLAELFTANKILGESYKDAIEIIKGMQQIPHSELFDKTEITRKDSLLRQDFGSGKIYAECKKIKNKMISESKGKSNKVLKSINNKLKLI